MKGLAGFIGLGVVLVAGYCIRQSGLTINEIPPDLEVGAMLCLPETLRWNQAERAILIVSNVQCPSCVYNRPFEDELNERASGIGIPVWYIVAERPDQDGYATGWPRLVGTLFVAIWESSAFGEFRLL